MKGWVYIATNQSLVGQVKIGFSDRHPDQRMKELSGTGHPFPFVCAYAILCDSAEKLEQATHRALKDKRVTENKEFFYMEPAEAFNVISSTAKQKGIAIRFVEKNEKQSFFPTPDNDNNIITTDDGYHREYAEKHLLASAIQADKAAAPLKGQDITRHMVLTSRQAQKGLDAEISIPFQDTCKACQGSGAFGGTEVLSCEKCSGLGIYKATTGKYGVQQTCPSCHGTGKFVPLPCGICHGLGHTEGRKTVVFKIPPGVKNGTKLRCPGHGYPGAHQGPAGDLFIEISIQDTPT